MQEPQRTQAANQAAKLNRQASPRSSSAVKSCCCCWSSAHPSVCLEIRNVCVNCDL
ncbi:hypothetical protein BDZ97DRAFT_1847506 [Flammula alnicola]|nr:hypothetical protein BDZ97DRAFT_1847506 [Flammula alnicola]